MAVLYRNQYNEIMSVDGEAKVGQWCFKEYAEDGFVGMNHADYSVVFEDEHSPGQSGFDHFDQPRRAADRQTRGDLD